MPLFRLPLVCFCFTVRLCYNCCCCCCRNWTRSKSAAAFAFARAFLQLPPRLPIWLENDSSRALSTISLSLLSVYRSLFLYVNTIWRSRGMLCVVRSTPAARRMLNGIAGDNGFYSKTPAEQRQAPIGQEAIATATTREPRGTNQRSALLGFRLSPLQNSSVQFVSVRREALDARRTTQLAAEQWLGLPWRAWLPLVRLAFSICPCWQRHRQRQRYPCMVVRISFFCG